MQPRSRIYYWKCDRPAAFHGTEQGASRLPRPEMKQALQEALTRHFGSPPVSLQEGGGQGNHVTFLATLGGCEAFIRVDDGPERDDYLKIESHVLDAVRAVGVPTPRVLASDASRAAVPFAWQALERLPHPDLNCHFKAGNLNLPRIARQAGRLAALWQNQVAVAGYGPFDTERFDRDGALVGHHPRYVAYFHTELDRHLRFLSDRGFLTLSDTRAIGEGIACAQPLLELAKPCLVHKDLALWNLLGTPEDITAVIDWDDCVGGDPLDDLSLLACFYGGEIIREALAGYREVLPLPDDYRRRFWLHLLRNMLFKAVIRVGAGYFDLSGGFFLIGPGGSGSELRDFTLNRLRTALRGLADNSDPVSL